MDHVGHWSRTQIMERAGGGMWLILGRLGISEWRWWNHDRQRVVLEENSMKILITMWSGWVWGLAARMISNIGYQRDPKYGRKGKIVGHKCYITHSCEDYLWGRGNYVTSESKRTFKSGTKKNIVGCYWTEGPAPQKQWNRHKTN